MRGRDKLLLKVRGVPLLRRSVDSARDAGLDPLVILGTDHQARRLALGGSGARICEAPEVREGMGGSIRAGIARLPDRTQGVLIVLPDMPGIRAREMKTLVAAARGDTIIRAASRTGIAGNPVLFPAHYFPDLLELKGDRGARMLLSETAGKVRLVRLGGYRALVDLDTPESWQAWRAGGSSFDSIPLDPEQRR